MSWQVQYRGGDEVLIVAPAGLALLPGSAPDELVAAAWTLLETGPDVVELVRSLNSELPGLASGAVAVESPTGCVVLLKGAATAVIADSELTAESAFAWSEHHVGGGGFQVAGPRDGEPVGGGESEARPGGDGRWLPIRSGVVRAGAVHVVRGTSEDPGLNEARVATPRRGSSSGSDKLAFTSAPPAAAGESSVTPQDVERSEALMDLGEVEADDEYAWLFEVMSSPPGGEEATQEEAATGIALAVAPDADDQQGSAARTPEVRAPAGQEPMPGPEASDGPSTGPLGEREDLPGPPTAGPPLATELPTIPSRGLPGSRAAVQFRRETPIESPSAGSERHIVERPLVDVVDCPSGHPNAPTSAACRVCGRKVRSGTVRTVPRPPLGVLRLVSDSPGAPALIPLDADRLLGRGPRRAHELGCIPVVIGTPGVDLSRDHLQVALEGWHIKVTDLGSLNGTTVCPDGGVAAALASGEPCRIDLGCLVTLADVVTYRFEAPA